MEADNVTVAPDEPVTSVGPGAYQDAGIAPRPLLEGCSEEEYVVIFNPLSVTFVGKVGNTRPANAPVRVNPTQGVSTLTRTEGDLRTNYGLDLRNPHYQTKTNIIQQVPLESGKTTRLPGNVAAVVVAQLVTEIMSREGKKLLLADLHARRVVETRIIRDRGFIADFLGYRPLSVDQQLAKALEAEPEKELIHEASKEFAGLTGEERTDVESDRRNPGRPRKSA